jgi:hypothetical protein
MRAPAPRPPRVLTVTPLVKPSPLCADTLPRGIVRRSVPSMSDESPSTPDGSTDMTDEQKKHTDELSDGSPSGNATDDPQQDSDTSSGGDPA